MPLFLKKDLTKGKLLLYNKSKIYVRIKCYDRDKIGLNHLQRAVSWCKAAGCCPKILTLEQSAESYRTSRCDRLPRVTGEACYSALSGRQGQSGCHSLQQQEWYRGSNCLRLFLRNRRRGFFYCEAAKLRHSACQRARRSPFSADGKEYVNRAYAVLKEGAANCSPIGHVTIAPCRFTLVEDFQTPTRKDRIIS